MSSEPAAPQLTWAERAAERSPMMQRSRSRSIEQARTIIEAGRRLMERKGDFTTQELVEGSRRRAPDLLPVLREQGSAARRGPRGSDRLADACPRSAGRRDQRSGRRGCASTSPGRCARLGQPNAFGMRAVDHGASTGDCSSSSPTTWRRSTARSSSSSSGRWSRRGRSGALSPTDPEHDARLIIELVRSVFHHYAFASLDRSIDEIADQLWSFCLRAVGGVPGRKRR